MYVCKHVCIMYVCMYMYNVCTHVFMYNNHRQKFKGKIGSPKSHPDNGNID